MLVQKYKPTFTELLKIGTLYLNGLSTKGSIKEGCNESNRFL